MTAFRTYIGTQRTAIVSLCTYTKTCTTSVGLKNSKSRIENKETVLNSQNMRKGIKARRGDGTLGELIPHANAIVDPGFAVARGKVATIEIGIEVKILAKAMIKQIDRVMTDLREQAANFRKGLGNPICVGIVGVNHADVCTSYEGSRSYTTGGDGGPHPIQEAPEAIRRLEEQVRPSFDEFLIITFKATNVLPYKFQWFKYNDTAELYGAMLARTSQEYQKRF